jgi:hypothetical protein
MDIKYIYDYLNELSKCVWYNNAIENGIRYNDIDISQGTEYYRRMLYSMHENVEQMLLELSVSGQHQMLQALYVKVTDIYEQSYDVLTIEDVEALKRDTIGNTSASVKAEIELGYFVVQMHSIQRYYQHTLLTFLGNLLGVQTQPVTDETDTEVEDIEPTQTPQIDEPQTAPQSEDERIIKGVKGLGRYLGCGTTKAQEILNSGLLRTNAVAYRSGKGWRINAEKLDKLLADNTDIFKGVLTRNF